MPRARQRFEPVIGENVDVVDTFDELDVDEHNPDHDHDDRNVPAPPPLLKRLAARLKRQTDA